MAKKSATKSRNGTSPSLPIPLHDSFVLGSGDPHAACNAAELRQPIQIDSKPVETKSPHPIAIIERARTKSFKLKKTRLERIKRWARRVAKEMALKRLESAKVRQRA